MNALFFALLLAAPLGTLDGVRVESQVVATGSHAMQIQRVTTIAKDRVKIEEGDRATIYDAKSGEVILLNATQKSFVTRTHADLAAAHQVPPTALFGLAIDADTGGPRVPAKTFVPRTRERVNGHDSIRYTTAEKDIAREEVEIWIARDIPVRWSDVQEVARAVFCDADSPLLDYFRQVRELDGYPVKSVRTGADHVVTETVTKVERVKLAADFFEPPRDAVDAGGRP